MGSRIVSFSSFATVNAVLMLVFLLHGQALGYGENWSSWQSVKAVGGGPFSKLDGISFRYKEGNHSKENKYYYYQFKNSSSEKVKLKWWITYVNSKGENQVERLSDDKTRFHCKRRTMVYWSTRAVAFCEGAASRRFWLLMESWRTTQITQKCN